MSISLSKTTISWFNELVFSCISYLIIFWIHNIIFYILLLFFILSLCLAKNDDLSFTWYVIVWNRQIQSVIQRNIRRLCLKIIFLIRNCLMNIFSIHIHYHYFKILPMVHILIAIWLSLYWVALLSLSLFLQNNFC